MTVGLSGFEGETIMRRGDHGDQMSKKLGQLLKDNSGREMNARLKRLLNDFMDAAEEGRELPILVPQDEMDPFQLELVELVVALMKRDANGDSIAHVVHLASKMLERRADHDLALTIKRIILCGQALIFRQDIAEKICAVLNIRS